MEPGAGSGNQGVAASAALHVSTVEDEQVPLICGLEVGDMFLLQNAGPETPGRRS